MRLRALRFVRFGRLVDRAFELGPLAVVHGPNESGKTTFATGLETMLFGFKPAVRAKHPLYLHDTAGGDLCLEGLVEDDGGELVAIERELLAKGQTRQLALGPAAEAGGSWADLLEAQTFEGARGGNATLDQAAFLDRDPN